MSLCRICDYDGICHYYSNHNIDHYHHRGAHTSTPVDSQLSCHYSTHRIMNSSTLCQRTCTTPECVMLAADVLSSMNMAADPCEDFYEYASMNTGLYIDIFCLSEPQFIYRWGLGGQKSFTCWEISIHSSRPDDPGE